MVVIIAALSLCIWLFLCLFWGDFWRADCRLNNSPQLESYPAVCAVVPARNEAEVIATSLSSLLDQDYAGEFKVILVDDNSSDRTKEIASNLDRGARLSVITGQPLAPGWQGKLWAMHQGIESSQAQAIKPDYWLFTDADIQHDLHNLTQLVTKAEAESLDLVSLMVLLHCQSFWEKLLIPAFVFFFQMLYPFPWVNNPHKSIAAAAGGCVLISNEALSKIGGISSIKNALIDDCSLAQAVKATGKQIWLGLSQTTISLRGYHQLAGIWDTIARTAYTQLNYSPLLLIGTVIGMIATFLIAPIGLVWGLLTINWLVLMLTGGTWLLMFWAYLPTIRLYRLTWVWGGLLPAIAFLYTLMTIDSAVKFYRGQGGAWKGRTYD